MQSAPNVTLRTGETPDASVVAEIWRLGWRDGHHGLVPRELVDARTEESFQVRALQRIEEMTVGVVDGAIAGFILVVDDEVEQVYVSSSHRGTGVARVLLREAERQVCANGHATAWLAVVAGNARARAFYERAGWRDEGPFEYAAASESGPIAVPAIGTRSTSEAAKPRQAELARGTRSRRWPTTRNRPAASASW